MNQYHSRIFCLHKHLHLSFKAVFYYKVDLFFWLGKFFSFTQMFHTFSSFQPVDCGSFQSQKGAFSFTFPSCICLYAHTRVHTNRYTHTPHSGSNASVDVRALPDLSKSHWITRGNIYSIFCNNLYGKRIQKTIDTCLCKLNHFAIYLKLIQHCKSTRLQSKNKQTNKKLVSFVSSPQIHFIWSTHCLFKMLRWLSKIKKNILE